MISAEVPGMRYTLAPYLAASLLLCAVSTAVRAQTTITRGIHELPMVTPVEPEADSEPSPAEGASSGTTVDSLTVQGTPSSPKVVEKQSRAFVLTYAKPTEKLDQLARWNDPICVAVEGAVDPGMADKIKARIEGVAKTLGVRVVTSKCGENIEILFSQRPQYWLDWIAAHRDAALGFHSVPQTKTLKTVVRSIQAWYVTSTRCDGLTTAAALTFSGAIKGFSARDETVDNDGGVSAAGCGYSRFTSVIKSVFSNVLVFVDSGSLKDREPGAAGRLSGDGDPVTAPDAGRLRRPAQRDRLLRRRLPRPRSARQTDQDRHGVSSGALWTQTWRPERRAK